MNDQGQGSLFTEETVRHGEIERTTYAPYQPHSETSREAAARILRKAPALERKVYRSLRFHGPATDKELQKRLGMIGSTERPRRRWLVLHEVVENSGEKRNGCTIWRVARK